MIPNLNTQALEALLRSEPIRSASDNRSAVRKAMDENEAVFRDIAHKGHQHAKVVDAFIAGFPEIRQSRADLDDATYREHVAQTFTSFKRKLGLTSPRPRTGKSIRTPKLKPAVTAGQPMVAVQAPVVVPTVEPTPVAVADKPEIVIPKRAPVVEPAPAVSPIGRNKIRSLDEI